MLEGTIECLVKRVITPGTIMKRGLMLMADSTALFGATIVLLGYTAWFVLALFGLIVMGVVCILVLGILIPKSLKAQQHYNDTKFNVYGVTEQVALENTEGMESYNFNDAKVVEFVQNYLAPKFAEIHANDIGQQLMTYVDVRSEKSMHIYYACTVKSNDEMIEDVISYDWEITLEAVSNDGTLQINYKEPRNYKTFNAELVSKSLIVREDTDKDAAKVDTLKKGNIATISAYCNDGETQWFKVGENQWVVYNGENLVMSAQVKQ